MSLRKASGYAISTICLLGATAGSAHAGCSAAFSYCAVEWSDGRIINLGGLPGTTTSTAYDINDAGQAVGYSVVGGRAYATEWSGDSVINLGGLSGSTGSDALSIDTAGQAVGFSTLPGGNRATEWTGGIGGSIINLGGLPGSTGSVATSINNAAQTVVVGYSDVDGNEYATEWSGGKVIDLGGLPSATSSEALSINSAGQVVGYSVVGGVDYATEWSDGSVINLGGLSGSTGSQALGINAAGQAVGFSTFPGGVRDATEWSGGVGGSIINLGSLEGYNGEGVANGINDAGEVVGASGLGLPFPTKWSGGKVISLGANLGAPVGNAYGLNEVGQIVGNNLTGPGARVGLSSPAPASAIPETSTWAMMVLGFGGLGFLGYRQTRRTKPLGGMTPEGAPVCGFTRMLKGGYKCDTQA